MFKALYICMYIYICLYYIWPLGGDLLGALPEAIKQILKVISTPERGSTSKQMISLRGITISIIFSEPLQATDLQKV